ncbi:sulfatase-like hydrolase/transferase [Sphingobium scionense]
MLHCKADGKGGQSVEDTGPLTKKRMETIDHEVFEKASDFIGRAVKADTPFFVWFNTTRMHNFTHPNPKNKGRTGLGFYADGMVEHDDTVGEVLDFIDKEGLAENTIVIYTTDNGPMQCLFPDAGSTPFRSEKNTNWDGGWRVPAMIRWPGVVKPGSVFKGLMSAEDWFPTLVAAAWNPEVKDQLLQGTKVGDTSFKVHLDGFDETDYLSGKAKDSARKGFLYFSDDGDLLAVRGKRVKAHFMVQDAIGFEVWRNPFRTLRAPMIFDLQIDPYEKSSDGINYLDWTYRRSYVLVPIQEAVGKVLATFNDFPPRQKPASFTVGDALEALEDAMGSKGS